MSRFHIENCNSKSHDVDMEQSDVKQSDPINNQSNTDQSNVDTDIDITNDTNDTNDTTNDQSNTNDTNDTTNDPSNTNDTNDTNNTIQNKSNANNTPTSSSPTFPPATDHNKTNVNNTNNANSTNVSTKSANITQHTIVTTKSTHMQSSNINHNHSPISRKERLHELRHRTQLNWKRYCKLLDEGKNYYNYLYHSKFLGKGSPCFFCKMQIFLKFFGLKDRLLEATLIQPFHFFEPMFNQFKFKWK